MATICANSEAAIFSRMFDARSIALSPDAARSWLELDFSDEDRVRMHELAERAQSDALTAAEELELANYRDVGNCLAILHSRARRILTDAPDSGIGE